MNEVEVTQHLQWRFLVFIKRNKGRPFIFQREEHGHRQRNGHRIVGLDLREERLKEEDESLIKGQILHKG